MRDSRAKGFRRETCFYHCEILAKIYRLAKKENKLKFVKGKN
jgi:hypothetical protein